MGIKWHEIGGYWVPGCYVLSKTYISSAICVKIATRFDQKTA